MGQYYKAVIVKNNKKTPIASFEPGDFGGFRKLMEHSYINNGFVNSVLNTMRNGMPFYKARLIWSGDYADPRRKNGKTTLYNLVYKKKLKYTGRTFPELNPEIRFAVNHSKKVYIDLSEVKADKYGYKIHPVPILTSDGNGRGGGDYYGTNMEYVGTWAGDMLSMETKIDQYPKYKKLSIDFKEE